MYMQSTLNEKKVGLEKRVHNVGSEIFMMEIGAG